MKAGLQILRTEEIDASTWEDICKGYEVCFGITRTLDQLKQGFSKSVTGYTLHAVKYNEDGNFVGHNYYQPRPYILNGKKVICALSGGTLVMPEYRNDIFAFNEMVRALDKEAAKLGWVALLGVPNENSFKYAVKINKQKHIGDLSYYILPIHAGKVLKKDNSLINALSSMYSRVVLTAARLFSVVLNIKEKIRPLRLDYSDAFLNIRYDWNKYKRVTKDNLQGVYRVYDEGGIKTAYITYFGENHTRSIKSLCFVVNEILKTENVDAILYIGTLNFPQTLLMKVPMKFVPQRLPLCVTVLDKKNPEIKEVCSSLDNIDFGLINFDVR